MELEGKLSMMENTLARQLQWIAAADSKVATIFAIDTAMLGVLAALAAHTQTWFRLGATAGSLCFILLLSSLIMAS